MLGGFRAGWTVVVASFELEYQKLFEFRVKNKEISTNNYYFNNKTGKRVIRSNGIAKLSYESLPDRRSIGSSVSVCIGHRIGGIGVRDRCSSVQHLALWVPQQYHRLWIGSVDGCNLVEDH